MGRPRARRPAPVPADTLVPPFAPTPIRGDDLVDEVRVHLDARRWHREHAIPGAWRLTAAAWINAHPDLVRRDGEPAGWPMRENSRGE